MNALILSLGVSLLGVALGAIPDCASLEFEWPFFMALLSFPAGLAWMMICYRGRSLSDGERFKLLAQIPFALGLALITRWLIYLGPVCHLSDTLTWMLLPLCSLTFSVASAAWALHLRPNASRVKQLLWALLPALVFAIRVMLDLLYSPRLALLHPWGGYFPGPLYDEWIPKFPHVWTALLGFFGLAIGMLFTASPRFKRASQALIALVLTGLVADTVRHWGYRDVHTALSQRIEGPLVTLYTAPQLSRARAKHMHTQLDTMARHILEDLELASPTSPVTIYLYPDATTKKRLTGTHYTLIGHPLQRALHVLDMPLSEPTWVHELTHALVHSWGTWGFPKHVVLLEGLATAVQTYRGDMHVHEWAKALKDEGILPDVPSMFAPMGFWRHSGSLAYLTVGSFSRWLIDELGLQRFRRLYNGDSVVAAYGRPLENLVRDWHRYLDGLTLSPQAATVARQLKHDKPLRQKRCPHRVASRLEDLGQCPERPSQSSCQQEIWQDVYALSGSFIPYGVRLCQSLIQTEQLAKAKTLANQLVQHPESQVLDQHRAHLILADLSALDNDAQGARVHLQKIPETAPYMLWAAAEFRRQLWSGSHTSKATMELLKRRLPTNFPLTGRRGVLATVLLADVPLPPLETYLKLPPVYVAHALRHRANLLEAKLPQAQARDELLRTYEALEARAQTLGHRAMAQAQLRRLRGT